MNEYSFTIKLQSNLHIGSGFGFARIIDHLVLKDAEGLAYIPASTIKGKLRSLCRKIALTLNEQNYHSKSTPPRICDGGRFGELEICKSSLKDACILCRLFGSTFQEGKLIFTDAKLTGEQQEILKHLAAVSRFQIAAQDEIQTHVKLSRQSRIASPKHLFSHENTNSTLSFTGTFYVREPFNLDPPEKELLKFGLKSLTHLGGNKARGLGRILSIEWAEKENKLAEVKP